MKFEIWSLYLKMSPCFKDEVYKFITVTISYSIFRIPFAQGYLVPSFVKIGTVVLERTIIKCRQYIFAIILLLTLGKGRGPFS